MAEALSATRHRTSTRPRWRAALVAAADWLLGLGFLVAALLKLQAPGEFAASLERLNVLAASALAHLLIGWEIAWVALLLFTRNRSLGRVVLWTTLLVYTLVLAVAWAVGTAAPCGCFGAEMATPTAIGRNLGLLALTAVLWSLGRDRNCHDLAVGNRERVPQRG